MTENDSSPSDPDAERSSDPIQSNPSGKKNEAPRKTQHAALRLSGLGIELAGFTLAFMGVGYVFDTVRGHDTGYATAFGTLVGFTLGMIRFIRDVKKISGE